MFQTRNGSVWLEGALIWNCPCRGIGWGVCNTPLLLGTPLGHPPIKWFPTRANEWRSPLSAGRVGAQKHTPSMFQTRNGSAWPQDALICNCPSGALGGAYAIRPYPGSAFASAAPKMFSNVGTFGSAAPVIFFRENCNKRRASASQ